MTLTFWDPQLCETRASQPRILCCSALQTSLPRRSAENDSSLSIGYGQEGLSALQSPSSQPADRCRSLLVRLLDVPPTLDSPGHPVESRLLDPSSRIPARLAHVADPGWRHGCEGKLVENEGPPFGMSFRIHHQYAKGIANDAYVFLFDPHNPENEHMGPFVHTSFVFSGACDLQFGYFDLKPRIATAHPRAHKHSGSGPAA